MTFRTGYPFWRFGELELDGPYRKRRRPIPWVPILIYAMIIAVTVLLIRSIVYAADLVYLKPAAEFRILTTVPATGESPAGYEWGRQVSGAAWTSFVDTLGIEATDTLQARQSARYRVRAWSPGWICDETGCQDAPTVRRYGPWSDPSAWGVAVVAVVPGCSTPAIQQ